MANGAGSLATPAGRSNPSCKRDGARTRTASVRMPILRILIAAFGTRGDVQPMLALALGLQGAGHTVTFAAPPNFAEWIWSFGLRFESVGSDIVKAADEVGLNVPRAMQMMRDEMHRQFDEIA